MGRTSITSKVVRHGAIQLHYAEAGSGPLLLFLHGFPDFWYMWRRQLEHFSAGYRVVAPDLRGYNLSSQPDDVSSYRMAHLVDDVRRLADHLGAERFTLVGHDWGGVIAWRFAQACAERVDRLVIMNAPHPAVFRRELLFNPRQQWASKYIALFRSPIAERVVSRDGYALLRKRILEPLLVRGRIEEEDVARYLESWQRTDRLRGPLNYYRAVGKGGGDDAVRLPPLDTVIGADTLVLWGMRDSVLRAGNLDGLDQYVRKLRVERIVHASHWIVHERPGRVNRALESFLAEPQDRGGPARS